MVSNHDPVLWIRFLLPAIAAGTLMLTVGCGSSGSSASTSSASSGASTQGSASSGTGALSADAHSAATGDIPDNQVFLVFRDSSAGFSMKYPEGWTQAGAGNSVTFRNKNNLVHITVAHSAQPTAASVSAELKALKRSIPSLAYAAPQLVPVGSAHAVKVRYTTKSAPNPVTGRAVLLIVDRYELSQGGRVATVDLGTPKGVDNVDAYRMMINSFRWR